MQLLFIFANNEKSNFEESRTNAKSCGIWHEDKAKKE